MTPEQRRALQAAAIRRAEASRQQGVQPNPDGTYGQPPEGMVFNPNTGQMTSRELLRGNVDPSRAGAIGTGYMQGYALNASDEAAGAVGGEFARERFRAQDEAAQEKFPGSYFMGQLAGNIVSPVTRVFGPVRSVKGAAGLAALEGGIDAFNRGEGAAQDRALDAAKGAGTGALFGAGTATALRVGSPLVRKLFTKSQKRPSIETLRATKNAAYADVARSGAQFSGDEMTDLYTRAQQIAAEADFDEIADPQTAAALRTLQARQGDEVSLPRLDKLRQTLWDRYNRGDEPMILDMIGEIDNLIESRAEGDELMQAARIANSRYAKAQLLENAFRKARLQTASTGSGGNILNKYRQAITRIITNPKEARWFSPEEIALMERFVEGDDVENVLRRAGKLAPGGNGLMTALNVYAATVDPAMLAVTAAASGAKEAADRSAMQGSQQILDAVSTGSLPKPPARPNLAPTAVGSGVAGAEYLRNR